MMRAPRRRAFQFLGVLLLVSLLLVGALPPSHAHANVLVVAGDCSGSLFKMPGMAGSHDALVLTAAHCLGIGKVEGRYLSNGEWLLDHPVEGHVIVKKAKGDAGQRLRYRKVLFATMTGTDLAVIVLESSLQEMIDRGYAVYTLASEPPAPGLLLEFDSFNRPVTSTCEVDKIVPLLREGPWTWKNVLRLKTERTCQYQPGQSGTAGIERRTNLIYAIAQTVYEGGPACTINNPCEVDPRTEATSVARIAQPYATPTRPLFDCYDRAGARFDFTRDSCPLKAPRGR